MGRAALGLSWLRFEEPSAAAVERLRQGWIAAVEDRPADLDVDPSARDRPGHPGADAAREGALRPGGGVRVSGYDATRAPQLDLIDDCVHCGFCLPTCPTYVLWGEEMDSPRGRIVLMKEGHEEISAPLVTHLDRCLGCMACVTACPSGVKYDKLIEDARPQLERNFERPPLERAHRRLIFELFTRPGRLRALAPGAALAQKLGLPRLARRPRMRRLAPRLAAMVSMTPEASMRRSLSRLPERFEARGEKRGTVALLQGCVQRVFFAHVNEATARVLAAEGFEVHVPRLPRCCGALPMHAGEDVEARALAKATIEALEGYDTVIVNAAGCGSAMKDYGHVLRDEPDLGGARRRVQRPRARRVRVPRPRRPARRAAPDRASRSPTTTPVTSPTRRVCALSRASCCAGFRASSWWSRPTGSCAAAPPAIYNLVQPEPAAQLGERKARNLLGHGSRGRRGGEPGLRASDHRAHRASRTPAAGAPPDGAAGPLDRLTARLGPWKP